MSLAVSRGIVDGVARDTMIAVAKAMGVHQAAGLASSAPAQPSRGPAA